MPDDIKFLAKWRTAKEERADVVFAFLARIGFSLSNERGSHFTYEHVSLAKVVSLTNKHDYISDPCLKSGRLVVVVQNGAVKGYILKRIIEACEYILEYEELERKRGGINHDKKR